MWTGVYEWRMLMQHPVHHAPPWQISLEKHQEQLDHLILIRAYTFRPVLVESPPLLGQLPVHLNPGTSRDQP